MYEEIYSLDSMLSAAQIPHSFSRVAIPSADTD